MALRNAKPLRHIPKGLSDAIDGNTAFKGAQTYLKNLIPDPSTESVFVSRPASVELSTFSGFTAPGFVSCLYISGNYAFGMVAATIGGSTGHDSPFMYNLSTGAFVTMTGITFATTPVSPATTGDWTPPTMATISTKVMVTHPGFDGITYYIGWIDISTPASPVWHAGNTTTNTLPGRANAVANFNNRAYYAIGNQLWYSDSLAPTVMTNAGQAITLGDTTNIVALAGQPLTSTTVGGVIQSLLAFKNSIIYQITGDSALSTLAEQSVNYGVGTFSPLSICSTPSGIAFVAPDGLRFIGLDGSVSDPVGTNGTGVSIPFIFAQYPSRTVAAYNENTLRVSVLNGLAAGAAQEYWFNYSLKIWTGPHTFPANQIQAHNKTFIMTPTAVTASLWQSDDIPSITSSYIENGNQLAFLDQTILLPDDDGGMNMNAMIETTIGIAFGLSTAPVTVSVLDQNNVTIDQVFITPPSVPSFWGTMIWGDATWGAGNTGMTQWQMSRGQPLVFKQISVQRTGNCVYGLRLGLIFLRYQELGYLTDGYY